MWAWPKQLRERGVLGMNSRNIDYIGRSNSRSLYPLVDNKLKTKKIAEEYGMSVPKLIGVVSMQNQLQKMKQLLQGHTRFVIKPAQGSGGKGILVITQRNGDEFIKSSGMVLDFHEVKHHTSNILSGLYSLGGRPDVAMIEDLIDFDSTLSNYSYQGVPDIRVIVYQGYPVMAMIRCSTQASDGKANLHQGAVGLGLDLMTGRGVSAIQKGKSISHHPDTGYSFDQLVVPHWDQVLTLASGCYEMTKLGYIGADIVLDQNNGPMVLELNARPGLAIQMANQTGLKKRLQVIDNLIRTEHTDATVEQRVQRAKQLFSQNIG